jgi:prepilin-type N-terminal cleavage/methylation domain-containing protein
MRFFSHSKLKGFTLLEHGSLTSVRTSARNSLTGFTLVEMIVSVAIFTVVMTISLGALLAISESDRRAQTLKSVINNLNFALDSMGRSIRTGTNYHCGTAGTVTTPQDCNLPAPYFAFEAFDGSDVAYCLDNGLIKRQVTTGVLSTDCSSANFVPITSSEVTISNLDFYVKGAPRSDLIQPKVTIVLSGYVQVTGGGNTQLDCGANSSTCTIVNLQTSVTQRLFDI